MNEEWGDIYQLFKYEMRWDAMKWEEINEQEENY